MKLDGGSSAFFFMSLVIFRSLEDAESAIQRMIQLRAEFRVHPGFEFKFDSMNQAKRLRFLESCRNLDYQIYSVVINKRKLYGKEYRDGVYLYTKSWKLLIDSVRPVLRDAKIIMDDFGGQGFRAQVRREMKAYANQSGSLINEVVHRQSRKYSEVQLADMMVGAVARSYSAKDDNQVYRKVVSARERSAIVYPS